MNQPWNFTCPHCNAKLLMRRHREKPKPREQAFCPHCTRPLQARDGEDTLGYELVQAPAPFELIDSQGGLNGFLHLRYGSGAGDPLPFVLTLTPQHVAHATRKTLPIMIQDVQEYAKKNADHLKAVAQSAKNRGLTGQVLE